MNRGKTAAPRATLKALERGFTLIELMIVVAVIGVLTAVALPAYQNYFKKAAYSEILASMATFKTAVTDCYNTSGGLTGCNANSNGIPSAVANLTSGVLNSLSVTNGTVSATPNAIKGLLSTEACTLQPTSTADGRLTWAYRGPCLNNNYVKN